MENATKAQKEMEECKDDQNCSAALASRKATQKEKDDLNHKHYEVQILIQPKVEMKIWLKYQ